MPRGPLHSAALFVVVSIASLVLLTFVDAVQEDQHATPESCPQESEYQ